MRKAVSSVKVARFVTTLSTAKAALIWRPMKAVKSEYGSQTEASPLELQLFLGIVSFLTLTSSPVASPRQLT